MASVTYKFPAQCDKAWRTNVWLVVCIRPLCLTVQDFPSTSINLITWLNSLLLQNLLSWDWLCCPGEVFPRIYVCTSNCIVFPFTWCCVLCPSHGWGGVAGANYPPSVVLISSSSLMEVLECNLLLLEPSLSSNEEEDKLWDVESPLVSSLWVRLISPLFPFFGSLEAFFFVGDVNFSLP